jgi:hypothetical protein
MTNPGKVVKSKVPEPTVTLQELLNPPGHIPQLDLWEYQAALRAFEAARSEVDNLGSLIMEKLIRKRPVQPGLLVATLDSKGRLLVWEERP